MISDKETFVLATLLFELSPDFLDSFFSFLLTKLHSMSMILDLLSHFQIALSDFFLFLLKLFQLLLLLCHLSISSFLLCLEHHVLLLNLQLDLIISFSYSSVLLLNSNLLIAQLLDLLLNNLRHMVHFLASHGSLAFVATMCYLRCAECQVRYSSDCCLGLILKVSWQRAEKLLAHVF